MQPDGWPDQITTASIPYNSPEGLVGVLMREPGRIQRPPELSPAVGHRNIKSQAQEAYKDDKPPLLRQIPEHCLIA
jgi:hypothetical protein